MVFDQKIIHYYRNGHTKENTCKEQDDRIINAQCTGFSD